MISRLLRAMFDDSHRGDDRLDLARGGADLSAKPPVLRRRAIKLIAILGIVVVFYGTLLPFQVADDRTFSWQLGWHAPASGDTAANVLMYIPVGAFLRLLFRRRGSHRVSQWAFSVLVAGALGYLTEVAQTVLPARVPSWPDALCNFSGAMIGIALAPIFQRALRNVHAWLYCGLRTDPLAAAAAAALICVCTYALAPLDLRPTPGHVTNAVHALRHGPITLPVGPGGQADLGVSGMQLVNKTVAAGSYGFLAFLLLLSAREAGRARLASAWYALSRSVALATVIELIQLFTISHVADLRDLLSAWVCAGFGAAAGCILVSCRPLVHRRPRAVLRGSVAVVAIVLAAWAAASVVLAEPCGSAQRASCLPIVSNFHRTWNSVLGDYTTGLLQYTLVAGLLALWSRSRRLSPRASLIIGGTLLAALLSAALAAHRGYSLDTGQPALALLAGVVIVRMDRAIFGRKSVSPAAQPSTCRIQTTGFRGPRGSERRTTSRRSGET